MNQRASDHSTRATRRRTGWLVGGVVFALLLAAVLWEGQPWRSATSDLVGTRWRIDAVRGAEVVRRSPFVPYLQFLPHRTIYGIDTFSAEDSCNTLQGTYAIRGNEVRFSGIITSLVGCSDGSDVIGALNDTRTWRKDEQRLTLYDVQGSPTLALTWSNVLGYDVDAPAPTPTRDPNLPPPVDESRVAVGSPSATST